MVLFWQVEHDAQLHGAYSITQVQEEVQSRVAALKSHVIEWIGILKHIIRGITSEVRFLLSFIASSLRELCRQWNRHSAQQLASDGSSDSSSFRGSSNNDTAGTTSGDRLYDQSSVLQEIGRILVLYLLRNLLSFPKYFGILPNDFVITGRHSANLKRLVQVLDRVVGGRLYDTTARPWMQPLNSVIMSQSTRVATMVQSVLIIGSAATVQQELQKQLVFDHYEIQLEIETDVLHVRKNVLLYLRCLMANSDECLSDMTAQDGFALQSAVKRLLADCGGIRKTAYLRLSPKQDEKVNLRIDNDLSGNDNNLFHDIHETDGPAADHASHDNPGDDGTIVKYAGTQQNAAANAESMHVCLRCGVTLPTGLRPAESMSRQAGASNFITLPPALNEDEKNFCWVLHNIRAVDAGASQTSFQQLLTDAMDSLKIEDVLQQSKQVEFAEQGSNRDFDNTLQRYIKFHQAYAKVSELQRSSTNSSGLKQLLRRIISVSNQQKHTEVLLQEILLRLRNLRVQIQEVNNNLLSKYRALAGCSSELQRRVQSGQAKFGVDEQCAAGTTAPPKDVEDDDAQNEELGEHDEDSSEAVLADDGTMNTSKLTRVLLQRLETDDGLAEEDGVRGSTGVPVRGVHMKFTLRWLQARGIVYSFVPSQNLPRRAKRDLEEKVVFVVTTDRRGQSSYIFNAVYDGNVVIDTFYVSIAHLKQLRRTVADFADTEAAFGGSSKIAKTTFRIKSLQQLCADELENRAVIVAS